MDAEALIGSLARGILTGGGRRKRGDRAASFLSGGSGSFLNSSTLLTVAGLAWGLYESAQPKTTVPSPGPVGTSTASLPPLPPLPELQQTSGIQHPPGAVAPEALRAVRLIISAARADSQLSRAETDEILELARQAGAESLVQQELQQPVPLAEIVAGVADQRTREDLYTLAFTIVHADEGISGAERIYLAQLALHLGLDAAVTSRLEAGARAEIKSAGN